MSARYEIADHGSKLHVRDTKYGSEVSMLRVKSYSRELTVMAGAIRQQSADIAELRAELAAVVAERDNLRICFAKACAKRAMAENRAEQAEARLSAIDSAPVVAVVVELSHMRDTWRQINYDEKDLPEAGTELIAKPAND